MRIRRWTGHFLTIVGGAFVLVYIGVALSRLGYPFELEWMEGGMVDHVRRVLEGRPVYDRPSLEFVSFLYPPLYYWVAAAFAWVLGPEFLALRLLSFLSSLGVFSLLLAIARRETGSWSSGTLAACLFAATYDRVGGWFDIARLDSFYLMLLLAAAYALRFFVSTGGALIAGVLLGAAFLTKQSAIVIAIPLLVHAVVSDPSRAPWFAASAGLIVGGGTLLLDRMTGWWFHYYCVYLPSRHPRLEGGITAFWTDDLLPALPFAAALAFATAFARARVAGGRNRFFFPLFAAGLIGSSWSVRNMVGAEVNNLLPAFAAVALLAAVGLDDLRRRASSSAGRLWRSAALGGEVLLLAQLAWLAYDPRAHLPSAADREAGATLVARLETIAGDVFVPHHGYLAVRAGKNGLAHTLAMDNVFLDDDGPARRDLEIELWRALAERRFAASLLESDGRYGAAILGGYRPAEGVFDDPRAFWPVAGGRLRPQTLCVPRDGSRSPGPRVQ